MKYINFYTIITIVLLFSGTNLRAELSSYEELVNAVADEASISRTQAAGIIDLTFGEIINRLTEKKGTSIPDFGRFYVQEKYSKGEKSNSTSKKSVLSPRFSMAPELKKKVGGIK